jgi:hypothetical protein
LFSSDSSCPSINGYFAQSLRQIRILILKIFKYIPAVKILILLDLEQNNSFLDGHYLIGLFMVGKIMTGAVLKQATGSLDERRDFYFSFILEVSP